MDPPHGRGAPAGSRSRGAAAAYGSRRAQGMGAARGAGPGRGRSMERGWRAREAGSDSAGRAPPLRPLGAAIGVGARLRSPLSAGHSAKARAPERADTARRELPPTPARIRPAPRRK